MLPPSQLDELVARHKAAQSLIIRRTSGLLVALWDALGSWDRPDVEPFTAATAPHVAAAKEATVRLATGFYSRILERQAPALPVAAVETVFNAEAPFTAVWHALTEGRPFTEAVAAGSSAVDAQAQKFVNNTARRTGDHVTERLGVRTRWRRVPSSSACPFCVRVAGQTYLSSATADFGHNRCGCTAVPVAA